MLGRPAAYTCRQIKQSLVKSDPCKHALATLSYAFDVAKPLSLFMETYGIEQGEPTAADVTKAVKMEFDCFDVLLHTLAGK